MYNFQPNQTLKLYIYACTSGVYLHIKIVFLKSVFELEWSRLSCYHVAAPLIRSYSYGGEDYKTIRLKHETIRARCYSWRTNERAENVSVNLNLIGPTNCWFIHRWQRCGPTDVATTEGPGGPHRGQTRETDQLHGQREHLWLASGDSQCSRRISPERVFWETRSGPGQKDTDWT